MIRRCAVAVFVKTPGLSPIKTRLVATAGHRVAGEFYRRAIAITEEVVTAAGRLLPGLSPNWAVAEAAGTGAEQWRGLPVVGQGDGGLGERMARVYDGLLATHGAVILIGADCPLLTANDLVGAARRVTASDAPFLIGRAADGGFYLFGGAGPVPRSVWTGVEYSRDTTATQLAHGLRPLGTVEELRPLPDVDVADDLGRLARWPVAPATLLPSQRDLLDWARAPR
jgi:uncharacterized protein